MAAKTKNKKKGKSHGKVARRYTQPTTFGQRNPMVAPTGFPMQTPNPSGPTSVDPTDMLDAGGP